MARYGIEIVKIFHAERKSATTPPVTDMRVTVVHYRNTEDWDYPSRQYQTTFPGHLEPTAITEQQVWQNHGKKYRGQPKKN